MTKRDNEPRQSDETIWEDAKTLSAADTKDARIHVTLRLDAPLYRAILAQKKENKDRTITATIERLLHDGLNGGSGGAGANREMLLGLRDVIAHGAAQDAILVILARNLHIDANQKRLFEALQAHFAESHAFRRWFAQPLESDVSEISAREELVEAIFNPIPLDPAS